MTDFTNIDLKNLPQIPDLKISSKWNSVPSYSWVLETLIDYYLGISNLEGSGWLVENWWRIEKELVQKGRLAVVYYGKQLLIAEIIKLEKNFEQKIIEFVIKFLDDDKNRKVVSRIKGQVLKEDQKPQEKKPGDIDLEKVVIFRNNPFEKGDFTNLSNDTQKLDMYLELIRHSLEMTKDVLIIKTKGKMSTTAEENIVQGLAKGKLVNIYYEDRRTKQPVDPNSYSHELQGGDYQQREVYWKEYKEILEGIYEKHKIRHIDSADKFSRTNNPEVYSNLASYWSWEQQRRQVRNNSIKEFMEKFPKEGECRLKYGFIFSSEDDKPKGEIKEKNKNFDTKKHNE